jgi:hypothetical protein
MSTKEQIDVSHKILKVYESINNAVCSGLPRDKAMRSAYVEVADALGGFQSPELYNSVVSLLASGAKVELEDILIRVVSWDDQTQ